jgi:hypothetical protein
LCHNKGSDWYEYSNNVDYFFVFENVKTSNKAQGEPVGYNDLFFRIGAALVAAHFITAFGEKETFFQLLLDPDYYWALLYSFIIAFILLAIVNFITVKLDRVADWKLHPVQRTALQVFTGWGLPSIIAFLLAAFYFRCFGINILKTLYVRIDYPLIVLMLLLANLYYLSYYLFLKMKQAEAILQASSNDTVHTDERQINKEVFIVSHGTKNIPLPLVSVAYFFHEGNYNLLRTFGREDYIINEPLEDVQQQLPGKMFFRANRQMIVNFTACRHFEPAQFGKLELIVEPPVKEPIIISQKRTKAFKEWIQR